MSVPSRLYEFNETNTSTIGDDGSGAGADMTNTNVVSVIDPAYSNVASFPGNGYFTLPSASVPTSMVGGASRMLSFWTKVNAIGAAQFFTSSGNSSGAGKRFSIALEASGLVSVRLFNITSALSTTALVADVWYHIVAGFDTSDNRVKIYIDGVLEANVVRAVATAASDIVVGGNVEGLGANRLNGFMVDLRMYDDVIDSVEALLIYNTGPETFVLIPTLYTHIVDLVWRNIPGVTSYTITQKEDAGSDVTIVDGSTNSSITLGGITPGSSYEYKVYTNLDLVTPEETITRVAPIVDSTSVQSMLTRFGNDLTDISDVSSTALVDIDSLLREVLITGDIIETDVGGATFVEDAGSVAIPLTGLKVLTPFIQSIGAGQVATMVFDDDASNNVMTYDDTVDEVVFGATNYAVGEYMVIGKYKVEVKNINT